MSFLAQLTIDNTEIRLLSCHFGMDQPIASNGLVSQKPVGGGVIEFELESTSSTEFFDWMVSPSLRKSGSITFYRRDALSRLKRLDFTDAQCISYHEDFQSTGEAPMHTKMKISARELKVEDVSVMNNWAVEE